MPALIPQARAALDEAVRDVASFVAAAEERLAGAFGRDHRAEASSRLEGARLKEGATKDPER